MIINIGLTILSTIFATIVGFFPDAEYAIAHPSGSHFSGYVPDALVWLSTVFYNINWFFPADTFFIILKLIFGIEILLIGIRIVMWLISTVSFGIIKNKI